MDRKYKPPFLDLARVSVAVNEPDKYAGSPFLVIAKGLLL